MQKYPGDPRVDKIIDHRFWEDVLWNSWNFDKALFYLLHGIRCGGAELTLTNKSYMLLEGEWNTEEWDDIKQNRLSPFKDKLVHVFTISRMGRVDDKFYLPDDVFTNPSLRNAWFERR